MTSNDRDSGVDRLGVLARATFRGLLRILPRRFRRREQSELYLLFAEQLAAARQRGRLPALWFAARAMADIVCCAVVLRSSGHGEQISRKKRRGGDAVISTLLGDARFAVRSFVRRPLLPATAIGTLAIGLGTCVAIFTVVYGVLLRPLGLEQAHELVNVRQHHRLETGDSSGLSPAVYHAVRDGLESVQAVAAWYYDSVTLQRGGAYEGEPFEVGQTIVTSTDFFEVLGVRPLEGRLFESTDAPVGSGPGSVAVIGDHFWRTVFGGDPDVLDRFVRIDDRDVRIVGVASSVPPAPLSGVDIWLCDGFARDDRSLTRRLFPIARLLAPASPDALSRELSTRYTNLAAELPGLEEWSARATPLREDLVGGVSRGLWLGFGGVLLLLVLSCANYTNLMLARQTLRRREWLTRLQLGASGSSLTRTVLVESVLIALLGGTLGVIVAFYTGRQLRDVAQGLLPRLPDVRVDLPILAFAGGLSLLVGLACSVLPAMLVMRSLRRSSGGAAVHRSTPGGQFWRSSLAVAQMALALVLLVAAGLLVRSFQLLSNADPGFDRDEVVIARVYLDDARYPDLAAERAYFDELSARLEAVPGVERVATTTSLPMDPQTVDYDVPFQRVDRPVPREAQEQAYFRITSPGYFEAMGIPLLQGRTFVASDLEGPPVMLVSETMARATWPDRSPLGQLLEVGAAGREPFEVVGVVAGTSFSSLGEEPRREMYFPTQRYSFGGRALVARVQGDPEAYVQTVRQTALAVDANQPVSLATTLRSLSRGTITAQRFQSVLGTAIGLMALLLSVSGLYAIVAFWVGTSRFEIGVRMAVGASGSQIARHVVFRGLRVAAAGLFIGAVGVLFVMPMIERWLYGVQWFDPVVFVAIAVALMVAAIGATLLPARNASRLDPTTVLRSD